MFETVKQLGLWSCLGKQVTEHVCAEDGAPEQSGPLSNLDSNGYNIFTLVVYIYSSDHSPK